MSPGQIFCAQFSEDGNFYRSCVLEVVDRKHVKVQYVDFGNKEIIPVESLRVLVSEFQTQAIQAYECCLADIQPVDQVGTLDNSNYRLTFDLDNKNEISRKNLLKVVKSKIWLKNVVMCHHCVAAKIATTFGSKMVAYSTRNTKI